MSVMDELDAYRENLERSGVPHEKALEWRNVQGKACDGARNLLLSHKKRIEEAATEAATAAAAGKRELKKVADENSESQKRQDALTERGSKQFPHNRKKNDAMIDFVLTLSFFVLFSFFLFLFSFSPFSPLFLFCVLFVLCSTCNSLEGISHHHAASLGRHGWKKGEGDW